MYRVMFVFSSMMHGHYYSEWVETLEEAKNFVMFADQARDVLPILIEDENENEVYV